jgi:anti-sigma-K factor RskA
LGCEDYDDRLMELAMGTLAHDEGAALRHHLARGCPRCSGVLAEFCVTLSLLPLALTAESAPAAVREKLLARAADSRALPDRASDQNRPGATLPATRKTRWWIGPAIGGAIAASALVVGGVAWLSEHQKVMQLAEQADQKQYQIAALRNALAGEQETGRAIRSPAALMVSLEGAAATSGQGRIFIDPKQGKWWFAARGLKPLASDKTYEFWLIPKDQKPIPAGTFNVDASGVGYLTGAVPVNIGASALAAVTDEPAGGLPQPTGQIQIKGAIGN